VTSPDRDFSRELYPFLYDAPTPGALEVDRLLAEVRQSTLRKCADIVAIRERLAAESLDALVDAATNMAGAFTRGATLLAFGNGGSATDAQDAVADCLQPPLAGWRSLPAVALVDQPAMITAVANDVGYEHVFARQIVALGRPGDIALGFSTSGNSPSVSVGFAEAKRCGLVTIALVGNDGGALARSSDVGHCLVVRHDYIPRIQEAQATMWHVLLELVHEMLGAGN
jgi:D-sedoheptulose 7-phosphate isomerase